MKALNLWKICSEILTKLANIKQIRDYLKFQFFHLMMLILNKTLLEVEMKVKLPMDLIVATLKPRIPIWFSSSKTHIWASKPIQIKITEVLLAISKAKIKGLSY